MSKSSKRSSKLLKPQSKSWLDGCKAFFHYSESVALARAEAFIGFSTIVIGTMDWSPLTSIDFSTGFNKTQVISLGILSLVKGIFGELARRRGSDI